MLRGYLERRYIDGLTAIDALMEMQEWVSENIRAEHRRVWHIAEVNERMLAKIGRGEVRV